MKTIDYEYTSAKTLAAKFTHVCGCVQTLLGHDDDSWFVFVNKHPRIFRCEQCSQNFVVQWKPSEVYVWE